MGTGKILLVVTLVVVVVASVLIGLLCAIGSATLDIIFQEIVANQISAQVTLEDGHVTYEELRKPSIPVYKSFYFFNLTNPVEFEKGTAKAALQEIGPYTYIEKRKKFYLESENSSLLTYTQSVLYYYQASASGSNLNQDDEVCTINLPLMAGVYAVEGNSYYTEIFKTLLNDTSSNLYTCQTVTDLIWGYTDSLLESLYSLGLISSKIAYIQTNGSINDTMPSTIYTGVHDISKLAQFIQWDGHTHYLNTWPSGKEANTIRGTEGAFFKPNQRQGNQLELFIGDLQRYFDLENTDIVYHFDLKTLRYQFSSSTYKGAFSVPENAIWGSWCPDGLFYIGPIKNPELPLYCSKPHFLDGDDSLLEGIDGLDPSREEHESHFDVQPHLGVNLDFTVKLQLNVRLNVSNDFSFLENLQGIDQYGSLFVPMLYIDEHAEFSEDLMDYLTDSGLQNVISMELLVSKIYFVLVGVSIGCALVATMASLGLLYLAVSFFISRRRKEEGQRLLDPCQMPTSTVHKYYTNKLGD